MRVNRPPTKQMGMEIGFEPAMQKGSMTTGVGAMRGYLLDLAERCIGTRSDVGEAFATGAVGMGAKAGGLGVKAGKVGVKAVRWG